MFIQRLDNMALQEETPATAHASSSGTLSSIPTPTLYSPKILCAFQNVQCFFRLPCFGLCCAPAWGNFPLSVLPNPYMYFKTKLEHISLVSFLCSPGP